MKRTFLTLLFSFLMLAPALAQPDYTGRYAVEISGDDSWHKNGMVVKKFSDPIKIDFTLDLNLGPRSRGPMPHERLHFMTLEVGYEGEDVTFEIDLDAVKYTFQLYPVEIRGKQTFAGIVTISDGETERTAGVVAVKTSASR